MKRKSIIRIIVCSLCCITMIGIHINVFAFEHDKVDLMFYGSRTCKITNAEGQTLICNDIGEYSGDMDILSEDVQPLPGRYWAEKVTVEYSEKFTFTTDCKEEVYFEISSVRYSIKYEFSIDANVTNCGEITIGLEKENNNIQIKGKNVDYKIHAFMDGTDCSYLVSGNTSGKVTLKEENGKGVLSGVKNKKLDIEIWDLTTYDDIDAASSVYAYEDTITLSQNGTTLIAPGTGTINNNTTKTISNVYIAPANNDRNLMLTWNNVKDAKSYIIYKFNTETKEYDKLDTITENYYDIPNPSSDAVYRYKIAASKNIFGIGARIGKVSYAVSSVSPNNEKSNVVNVKLNRNKTLKLKRNKTKSLKTLLKGTDGKNLYSKNIRWYCSNKKVATVSKSGKIKAKRKGTCYVWAKAHNGTNSKHLKIQVR